MPVIALLILLLLPAAASALDIPLTVTEVAGIARTAEPVASGIPFSLAENVTSVAGFGVFDGTTELPAQFTVTSRWHGAPSDSSKAIRWVLVEFQPSCLANGSKTYTLKTSGGSGTTSSGMSVTNGASIVVNTGEAEFTLNKTAHNIFDTVKIKNPNDGTLTRTVVSTGSTGALITRTDNATDYSAKNNTTSVTVESQGPLHTVILATGKFRNGVTDLFDWKERIHFYQGKSYAKVEFSFVDKSTLTGITQYVNIDKVLLGLKMAPAGNTTYSLAGESTVHTGALTGTQAATLYQSGTVDQSGGTVDDGSASTIVYTLGGVASGSGNHAMGWADLSDSEKGVTVAVKYFWQLYPKKLEVANDGTVNVHLWPTEAVDMRMYAAAQKTHEVLYYFHNGAADGTLVNALYGVDTSYISGSALSRHHNLYPLAPSSRYADSQAIGYVGVRDTAKYPTATQATVSKYYTYVDGLLDRSLRERNSGGTRGGGHEYMMWNFGDSRDASWSNMAYDTLRADALQFAASGDRKFIDHLQEAAQHFRDVDVEHSLLNTRNKAGLSSSTPWLGRTRYNPAEGGEHDLGYAGRTQYGFEHYKGQGLADHYFLTGDLLSKDILTETAAYYATWHDLEYYNSDDNVRVASKAIGPQLGLYLATGDATAKSNLDHIVSYLNAWQRTVTANDPDGWMWMGKTNDSQSSSQTGLTINFLLDYMRDVPSSLDEKQNIVDACKFVTNPAKGFWTGSYFNDWPNYNYGIAHATATDFMSVGGLTYCTKASGTDFDTYALSSLNSGMDNDSSNGNLKPYAQKTRYAPTALYFLQSGVSVAGVAPVSIQQFILSGAISGTIH